MSNLPTKQEILDQIKADPEGTLRDIEMLKRELVVERMLSDSRDSLCHYFSSVAEEYWQKYHKVRRALIRARILVRELKLAAQQLDCDDLSADEGKET